jgi:hypothetical protein
LNCKWSPYVQSGASIIITIIIHWSISIDSVSKFKVSPSFKKLLFKLDYCANVIGRRMLVKIIKANNAHIMFFKNKYFLDFFFYFYNFGERSDVISYGHCKFENCHWQLPWLPYKTEAADDKWEIFLKNCSFARSFWPGLGSNIVKII